jgi:hypothetical protein
MSLKERDMQKSAVHKAPRRTSLIRNWRRHSPNLHVQSPAQRTAVLKTNELTVNAISVILKKTVATRTQTPNQKRFTSAAFRSENRRHTGTCSPNRPNLFAGSFATPKHRPFRQSKYSRHRLSPRVSTSRKMSHTLGPGPAGRASQGPSILVRIRWRNPGPVTRSDR